MKATCRALAIALVLAPAASFATKIPIPIEGATLNVSLQFQPQLLVNEAGTPDGTSASFDVYVRRTRLLVNGDVGPNFTYLLQVDNPNFGKYGNFTGRALVQDAWVGWAPTGITGPTVIYIDAGILLVPFSHHLLESTTNFVTADVQADAFRMPGNAFPAFRDTGVQIRGWLLNKKVGFRGGAFEGYTPAAQTLGGAPANTNTAAGANCAPATVGSCITPKRNPMFSGFVNFDVIGSEEGGWLYGAYKWGKDPVLSVGVAGQYQSKATKNAFGNLADIQVYSADVYLNFPMTEAAELVAEGTAYVNANGTGSANTGLGLSGNVGYRFGSIAPYVAYDYFAAKDCDQGSLTAAQIVTCIGKTGTLGTNHAADSRNFKAGLNFFFNKNLNHLNVEFQINHGTSAYGPQAINAGNAAYAPLSLDPATPSGPRRTIGSLISLAQPAYKSLLVHWNFLF
ncbi:MAG: hypothetical protein ABR567_19230 [Myxococcales bacterium]